MVYSCRQASDSSTADALTIAIAAALAQSFMPAGGLPGQQQQAAGTTGTDSAPSAAAPAPISAPAPTPVIDPAPAPVGTPAHVPAAVAPASPADSGSTTRRLTEFEISQMAQVLWSPALEESDIARWFAQGLAFSDVPGCTFGLR